MGYFAGGGVSFSGGPYTYSVSYSAPSYVPTGSEYVIAGPYVTASGPGSVSCDGSASQSYGVIVGTSGGGSYADSTSVGGSAPACPVVPPTYPPVWTDNSLAGFTASVAYSDGVSATNSPSYSVSAGSLPGGINLNTSNGVVSGTPTTGGQSYSFTLRAANGDGAVTASFSGTVAVAPTAGKLKTWNGTAWVYGPMKVWNGTAWVEGPVKVWNGTVWSTSV